MGVRPEDLPPGRGVEDYQLVKAFPGWSFDQIDNAPALRSDRVLVVARVLAEIEAEAAEE